MAFACVGFFLMDAVTAVEDLSGTFAGRSHSYHRGMRDWPFHAPGGENIAVLLRWAITPLAFSESLGVFTKGEGHLTWSALCIT